MLKIKSFGKSLLIAAIALLGIAGCKKEEQVAPAPELTVELGECTPTSISFTVNATNAIDVAYLVLAADAEVPAESEILTTGTKIEAGAEVTVESLQANTKYQIAVAASGENNQYTKEVLEAETLEEPAIALERAEGRIYGTSNNLGVTLRGVVDGIDYEIALDIYDDRCKETGYLGDGIYNLTNDGASGTFHSGYSYLQKDNDHFQFESGTLTVTINGTDYSLLLDAVLVSGETFRASFTGEIDGLPIK